MGLCISCPYSWADSLWARRDPRAAFLFYDLRARRVGDLLTIIVRESTDIANSDARKMEKESRASGLFNFKGDTKAGKFLARDATVNFDASGSAQRGFDGKSDYNVDRSFLDRFTVTVVDVLPNANLVIEGCRRQVVSGEMRTLRITGIVRPADIISGNAVLSQQVANLRVTYEGFGPESHFSNQGWLSWLINFAWPF